MQLRDCNLSGSRETGMPRSVGSDNVLQAVISFSDTCAWIGNAPLTAGGLTRPQRLGRLQMFLQYIDLIFSIRSGCVGLLRLLLVFRDILFVICYHVHREIAVKLG